MVYFCSDLDNTLIYSYRHDIGPEKVLVEMLKEKELSYMTKQSYELLKEAAAICRFVPVTTRSLLQYQRINFGSDVPIAHALVANGGILLEDGVVSAGWLEESLDLIGDARKELLKAIKLLEQDPDICFEIREVDQLFIFTKSKQPEKTTGRLKRELNQEQVYIDYNGSKVYVFPKIISKGNAVRRFHQRIGLDHQIICAGDSGFDISMVEYGDRGMVPSGLLKEQTDKILAFDRESFSEELLAFAIKYGRSPS